LKIRLEISKLIIVNRGGTVYNYWRKVKNINRRDMFYVLMLDGESSPGHYIIDSGKVIDDWAECLDRINIKIKDIVRDKKIDSLLND
jgi:hypothetical protein